MSSLARLAHYTGGRYTERTNDLSLAYARAQRDLACVYSLGVYAKPEWNRQQTVRIRVKKPGLRIVHPDEVRYRHPSEKRQSLLNAAWVAPEMFQTGVVRAHLFPLRPRLDRRWEALLAIAFDVPLPRQGAPVSRDFGIVLTRTLRAGGVKTGFRFNRRITLNPRGQHVTSTPQVTFLQRVDVTPGDYTVTAVMTEIGGAPPHAFKIRIEVPEIPKRDLFLVEPVLGRRSGPNIVVMGGEMSSSDQLGLNSSFEPLLVAQLDERHDVFAVTQACLVGKKKVKATKYQEPYVYRYLWDADGSEPGRLYPEPLVLHGEGKLKCQNLLDVLPARGLPDGEYLYEVQLSGVRGSDGERETARFVVGRPERRATDAPDPPPAGSPASAGKTR